MGDKNKATASNGQHDQWKFHGHRPRWAVLPAYPAVPALVGISNLYHFIFHIKHIQRTMLVADSASITLIPINHWWHDITPPSLFGYIRSHRILYDIHHMSQKNKTSHESGQGIMDLSCQASSVEIFLVGGRLLLPRTETPGDPSSIQV